MEIKVKSHLKPCAAVSIAIIIVALVMTLTGHGMNLGVDFTGGTIMTYNMGEQFEAADVEAVLADNGITDAQIAKTGDNDTQVQIRISDKENTDDLRAALESTLGEKYAGMEYVDISRVGAIAGRDLINNAIKSVSLAAVLMLIYIAGLMGVSDDLKEAAKIDGCDEKKTTRYITLPMMAGTFTICFFLAITRAFVTYDVNISLTEGGPFGSTTLAAMYVYNMAFSSKKYGLGQAEALILFLVIAVIAVTQAFIGKSKEVEA